MSLALTLNACGVSSPFTPDNEGNKSSGEKYPQGTGTFLGESPYKNFFNIDPTWTAPDSLTVLDGDEAAASRFNKEICRLKTEVESISREFLNKTDLIRSSISKPLKIRKKSK